ncbi:hypothetical protein C808_00146 [Lachnospiraceae bacterium M18-1]|nr:hypothetical protein C808_00146 [Lachnospiraceae bacterium M18-1]
MFGYITICEPELKVKDLRKYRAHYCGLCRTLKEKYGSLGQLTLSYDMTFIVVLLNSLYESMPKSSVRRCKTHPIKKQKMLQSEITEYAADMNVILTWYHLKDDWQDERKPGSLLGLHALGPKAKKAARKYPRQCRAMYRELKALEGIEAAESQDIDEAAGCFGRLMEEVMVYKKDVWERDLRRMGFFLGKFIYIMDAYEDLEKDLEQGNYNPLRDLSRKEDYEERLRQILCMMIAESAAAFEKLPCLQDADILRNILYTGVWNRYNRIQEKKKETQEKKKEQKKT